MLVERAILHLAIIPFVSITLGTINHLSPLGTVLLDLVLMGLVEAVLLKTAAALLAGVKSLPVAVPLAYALPIVLPTPDRMAVIFATAVGASLLAGLMVFAHRQRRHVASDRRRFVALLAMLACTGLETFASAAALSVPPVTGMHIAAVLLGVPLAWVAYSLQGSPRRGGSQARRTTARRRRAWDHSGHSVPAGGVS